MSDAKQRRAEIENLEKLATSQIFFAFEHLIEARRGLNLRIGGPRNKKEERAQARAVTRALEKLSSRQRQELAETLELIQNPLHKTRS